MIAFLFPGQGSQQSGMLQRLVAQLGDGEFLDRANRVLDGDLLADDTADGYANTAVTQRALFVAGVASAQATIAAGIEPAAVAGHSVGAYAAAVVAGALDFYVALRLVDLRGLAMAHAFPTGYGMGAIGGFDEARVAEMVRSNARAGEPVYAANVNARDQIAIAGSLIGVDAVLDAARAAGARSAQRINVGVPSHSPLMHAVAATLAEHLAHDDVRAARIPYAENTTGRLVRDAGRIRADLIANVERPVRWFDATSGLYERGVRTFIEMSPGHVLTDLATVAFPDARALAWDATSRASIAALARPPALGRTGVAHFDGEPS